MALNQVCKLRNLIPRANYCFFSTTSPTEKSTIKKSVFISQSNDIFMNLALEDWLYNNHDFTNRQVLMLWRNKPCVVIGRFQNPWVEADIANLSNITDEEIPVARRLSGGGTVYHDMGNLNMTFFTTKEQYNRKSNAELITRGIFRNYGLKIDRSSRDDLLVRNSKVSGTAAKLGRPNAYHHCTLLVNANKVALSQALHKEELGIKTNATKSVKSKIINLCEACPEISVDGLISALGWEYMRTHANSLTDGGKELALQQDGFQMINPTESWFPGINKIYESLRDWEWRYGKTPSFTVSKSFTVPLHFFNDYNSDHGSLEVTVMVDEGRISDVTIDVPPGLSASGFYGKAHVVTTAKGKKFTEDTINMLEWSLIGNEFGLVDDRNKFVTECVRQAMTSI